MVSCVDDSVELDCGVTLCSDQLVRCVRPCHALTYAGCQGLTLPGRVRLETTSPHFTLRHLYVGCSRATSSALLEVVAQAFSGAPEMRLLELFFRNRQHCFEGRLDLADLAHLVSNL